MRPVLERWFTPAVLVLVACAAIAAAPQRASVRADDLVVSRGEIGRPGGQLVISQRGEPKTLNPVSSVDAVSGEVIKCMVADLIHVNRETQRPEPALAKSWTASPDGRRYTLTLRQGIRFSDGDPFDADDVVFSFRVYLDEKSGSRQRDSLIFGGKPLGVRKIDQYTVQFDFPEARAAAERLFAGLAMLPRHLLEPALADGRFAEAWTLSTAATQIAGLGPFRFKEYVPGERIVLERNPYYWKVDRSGTKLPYLDRMVFLPVSSDDAQTLRFQSGEANIASRMTAVSFDTLAKVGPAAPFTLVDLGAGLDYSFLFFNLNDLDSSKLPAVAKRQAWFRQEPFRQAVSLAIDRQSIVRLVYRGHATPIWSHVPPGNKLWVNPSIPQPPRSLDRARQLLKTAGFTTKADGTLIDARGDAVEFSIVTNTGNSERIQMATIIQEDLRQLGVSVHVVTLELRAMLDRIMKTQDYDACVLGLGNADGSPNGEMSVWLSSGATHLWHPQQPQPATPWEAEIDTLMRQQVTTLDPAARKKLYDRVQELVAQHLPFVFLVSPNVLVGADRGLGNFRPAILDPQALWNVEELFWRQKRSSGAP